MSIASYHDLEHAISRWCQNHPDILAAIVIGSRGRLRPPPDELSDLDLILFVTDASQFTAGSSWLSDIGELWIAVLNLTSHGDPEWLALFEGGLKADLLFVTAESGHSLAEMLDSLSYQDDLRRGSRFLYPNESDSPVTSAPAAEGHQTRSPSEQELTDALNKTLLAAERFVKFVARNDSWRSQNEFYAQLKRRLLTLIEWHALSISDPQNDIWFDGRYIEDWADAGVTRVLGSLSPGPSPNEQWLALLSALQLAERLVTDTALTLGFSLPTAGQRRALEWLKGAARENLDQI